MEDYNCDGRIIAVLRDGPLPELPYLAWFARRRNHLWEFDVLNCGNLKKFHKICNSMYYSTFSGRSLVQSPPWLCCLPRISSSIIDHL